MSNDLDSKEKRPQILALATMDAVPVDAMAMANAVLRMLRRINRVGDLHSKELERLSGITTPQLIALRAIQELGEVTAGRIADHVSLSQGTVSMILDRLETQGLIARYRSPRDRRIVHARLTEAGERAVASAPPLMREQFLRRFLALDHSEQAQMVEKLSALADMMDAETDAPSR
jgi:DNA-binding MarR family transcriptional regulator